VVVADLGLGTGLGDLALGRTSIDDRMGWSSVVGYPASAGARSAGAERCHRDASQGEVLVISAQKGVHLKPGATGLTG
jgi:hypothetical protein